MMSHICVTLDLEGRKVHILVYTANSKGLCLPAFCLQPKWPVARVGFLQLHSQDLGPHHRRLSKLYIRI